MTAIICALLSAVGFYFSVGLGSQWWLAWLAPIPVLWYAFGETRPWRIFFASFAALALGLLNLLLAYGGLLPVPVLILAIGAPSLTFAVSVVAARRVHSRLGDVPAMFAFAALWTMFDLFASFSAAGGSVSTPAAAEVGAPMLMQSASLVGFLGVTFLMGVVAAGPRADLAHAQSGTGRNRRRAFRGQCGLRILAHIAAASIDAPRCADRKRRRGRSRLRRSMRRRRSKPSMHTRPRSRSSETAACS